MRTLLCLQGSWESAEIRIFRSPRRRMKAGIRFYLHELHCSGSKVPCLLSQYWKRYSWEFSKVRNRASVWSFRFTLNLVWLGIQARLKPISPCVEPNMVLFHVGSRVKPPAAGVPRGPCALEPREFRSLYDQISYTCSSHANPGQLSISRCE